MVTTRAQGAQSYRFGAPTKMYRPRIVTATLVAVLAMVASAFVAMAAPAPPAAASPPSNKDVTATLFQWRFDSIARECTNYLGPKGYGFVEVSPPMEHIQGWQWWTSYQPVSYRIAGRLGDETAFRNMITACHNAGVKVISDAVINHMANGSGTGTGGSSFTKYGYSGYYADWDFHYCRHWINNFYDRYEVQNCELVGLPDLDTGSDYVRSTIAAYLSRLIGMGVDGFRIDAAKHMPAGDLAAIKSKLSNPNIYWVHEVIYASGEPIGPAEYTGSGDVDEFRAAYDLKRIFTSERLAYLNNWGHSWGYLPDHQARPFVDNWDTERNGSTLNYKYGSTYTLANVFMLAWPYGSPQVYSGYEFTNNEAGPPNGGTVNSCFTDGWKCQHAWRQIGNMVGFRNSASGTGVTNWWTNDYQAIAFGRGNRGYVVINHESFGISRTFQTSLPSGTYCDVQHGERTNNSGGCTGPTYHVDSSGRFTATVGAGDAIALYV